MIEVTNIENFNCYKFYIDEKNIESISESDIHGMSIRKGKFPCIDENIYNYCSFIFFVSCSIRRTKIVMRSGDIHYVKESLNYIKKIIGN